MNIAVLFAIQWKSYELHRFPVLIYGRQKVMGSGKGVWRLRKMYASCKEGRIRGNERSMFNHVFFWLFYYSIRFSRGCERSMDAFVICISTISPSFLFSSLSLLVGLVSVAPCRNQMLIYRFLFFFICFLHNFIREYFF